MKAITLPQPWATLIAKGIKMVETRSWPAPKGLIWRRIAIHAGETALPADDYTPKLAEAVRRIGRSADERIAAKQLPSGCIVATARLVGVCRVDRIDYSPDYEPEGELVQRVANATGLNKLWHRVPVDPWGDFSVGRWLWLLDEIYELPEPFACSGAQGFWELVPPGSIDINGGRSDGI